VETIRNLWHGRAGLAKTYWVYGILGGALWGIPLALVAPGSAMAIMLVLAFIAYCIFVNTGIWRAANQYHGQAAWATLAKIVAAVSYAFMILVALGFIVAAWEAIGNHGPLDSEPDWEKGVMTPPSKQSATQSLPAPTMPSASKDDEEWWKKGSTLVN
jgi:hypothetical protein